MCNGRKFMTTLIPDPHIQHYLQRRLISSFHTPESPLPRSANKGSGFKGMNGAGAMIQQPHLLYKRFSTTSWCHNTPKTRAGAVRTSQPRPQSPRSPTFLDTFAGFSENVALYYKRRLTFGRSTIRIFLMSLNICRFFYWHDVGLPDNWDYGMSQLPT